MVKTTVNIFIVDTLIKPVGELGQMVLDTSTMGIKVKEGNYIADLSALGTLQPVEPLDLVAYKDNRESTFRLPSKGRVSLRAPDSFTAASFGRTNAGALSAQIDPTIASGEHEGLKLRFIKVSAKPFKRDGVTVSQLGDYLRATGFRGVLSSEQEQADAVEGTANTVFEAVIDWRAYNKTTGFSLEGMERFPKNPDGTYQPWVEDPNDFEIDADTGSVKVNSKGEKVHKRCRANLIVSRYIAAGN